MLKYTYKCFMSVFNSWKQNMCSLIHFVRLSIHCFYFTYYGWCRKEGDNWLFITFSYSLALKLSGHFMIGWFIKLDVQTFLPIIAIYRKVNFVNHRCGCLRFIGNCLIPSDPCGWCYPCFYLKQGENFWSPQL